MRVRLFRPVVAAFLSFAFCKSIALGQSISILNYTRWEHIESWHPICGGAVDDINFSYNGAYGHETEHEVDNDCWNSTYGYSDFDYEYWWNDPMHGTSAWRSGWFSGTYVSGEPTTTITMPNIPSYEFCNVTHTWWGDMGPGTSSTFSRTANTRVNLTMNQSAPKNVTVVVHVDADELRFDNGVDWWAEYGPIPGYLISVSGKNLNCSGDVAIKVAPTSVTEVTPVINGYPYWYYTISARLATQAYLTRSMHPDFGTPGLLLSDLQDKFDSISSTFQQDDDGCIPDTDPRVITGSPTFNQHLYRSDDVPVYVDFYISDASNKYFPSNWNGKDFTDSKYFSIVSASDYEDLAQYGTFASIKQVASLPSGVAGAAWVGHDSMVIPTGASDTAVAHEWGHMRGLRHRGDASNPDSDNMLIEANHDASAVMFHEDHGGFYVNRNERGSM